MRELLSKAHASWSFIEKLLMQQKVIETAYRGKKFYIKKLPTKPQRKTKDGLNDSHHQESDNT